MTGLTTSPNEAISHHPSYKSGGPVSIIVVMIPTNTFSQSPKKIRGKVSQILPSHELRKPEAGKVESRKEISS